MAELVNAATLARDLGVKGPSVARAVKTGRITYADPARKLFDLAVARIQWRENARRQRLSSSTTATAATRSAARADDPGEMLRARVRRERAEAELVELELRERSGQLCRVADLRRVIFAYCRFLRDALMGLPSRCAPLVAATSSAADADLILMREVRLICNKMAAGPDAPARAEWERLRALARRATTGDADAARCLAEEYAATIIAATGGDLEEPPACEK